MLLAKWLGILLNNARAATILNGAMTVVRIQQSVWLNDLFRLRYEGLGRVIREYQKAWDKISPRVIPGLEQVTGLNFLHNVIDVYIVDPTAQQNICAPLIISGGYQPREFVYILVHEITHKLLRDNKQGVDWHEIANEIFLKREDAEVKEHIITHAVLEALYTDVIHNVDHVIYDIRYRKSSPSHCRAWEIVTEKGYKEVLAKVKAHEKSGVRQPQPA